MSKSFYGPTYNRKSRKKLKTCVEAIAFRLEPFPNLPLRAALAGILVGFIGLTVLAALLNPRAGADLSVGVYLLMILWPLAVLTAFGTFDRLRAERNTSGRCTLTKTSWVLFIPIHAQEFDLAGYDGLYFGLRPGVSVAGKVAFLLTALALGCCPGLLLWWYVFYKPTLALELGRQRSGPRETLVQGGEERVRAFGEQLKEMAPNLEVRAA